MHYLRHRVGYRMVVMVPLHRLVQIMGHDSLDTTLIYVQGTKQDFHQEVETIAWASAHGVVSTAARSRRGCRTEIGRRQV